MSLECIDKGVKRKILDVYPNVVFGPLSRALQDSTQQLVDYERGGVVVTSDFNDYEITVKDSDNQLAAGPKSSSYGTERTSANAVVAFPLIAIDRIGNGFDFGEAANDPQIRRGHRIYPNDGTRERAFPINPMYQIDIISNRRVEVDEIFRELCFYLYLSPNISVIYSEGTDEEFEEKFPLLLLDTDPTTDVETFTEKGIVYRQTITTQVKDAKLLFHKDVPLIERIPTHYENTPWEPAEEVLKKNPDWIVEGGIDS